MRLLSLYIHMLRSHPQSIWRNLGIPWRVEGLWANLLLMLQRNTFKIQCTEDRAALKTSRLKLLKLQAGPGPGPRPGAWAWAWKRDIFPCLESAVSFGVKVEVLGYKKVTWPGQVSGCNRVKLALSGLVGEPNRRGTSLEPPVLIYNVQSIYEFSDILSR